MFGALTQNGTKRHGKGHSSVVVHLHLINAGHLIFDRFFHGDDLAVRFVDVIEAGVERTRFARASWAGHEQNAIGQMQ